MQGIGCILLHLVFEEQLQEFDIFDDGVDLIAIKGESLLKLIKNTDKIEYKAVRFHHLLRLVLIWSIHPGNSLEQGVITHRLIQIHRV